MAEKNGEVSPNDSPPPDEVNIHLFSFLYTFLDVGIFYIFKIIKFSK